MNNEINPIEEDFNAALSRYKSGQDLIPIVQDFQKIIQQIPNHFAAWTCLSWLQLLLKNNEEALAAARQAVRLNQQDPQARMNLSLALLATNNKGVRDHIELIKKMTKRTFGGTSRKRKRVSGFRVRMRSHTGRRVIKSRRQKGRERIAV